jgi:SiaC family regulatory phosphoprotein
MPRLYLPATPSTPEVLLDTEERRFSISGRAIPEHAPEFFGQVLEWLSQHLGAVPSGSTVLFRLPYFNTSSMKSIGEILLKLKEHIDLGNPMRLEWVVEQDDEFMQDAADTFIELLGLELMIVIEEA